MDPFDRWVRCPRWRNVRVVSGFDGSWSVNVVGKVAVGRTAERAGPLTPEVAAMTTS